MASLLKTIAFAAGADVAIGLVTSTGSRRAAHANPAALPGADILDLEPLLDRLETVERRFETASAAQNNVSQLPLTQLKARVEAQDAEIDRLRALVDLRAVEVEHRLSNEIDRRHSEVMNAIESTVELRISERIAAIERNLIEQSASIDSLRDRAMDTDSNLKRLIAAIERLCERPPVITSIAPPPLPGPGPQVVPFEAHLAEARLKQGAETPEDAPATIARVFRGVPDADEEPRKQRFPLGRIFGMLALMVLTQAIGS